MTVRAKFRVEEKVERPDGFSVKLWPVTGGSPENQQFYKYTPAGSIELSTINAAAAAQFIPGKEVYVDFIQVEDA